MQTLSNGVIPTKERHDFWKAISRAYDLDGKLATNLEIGNAISKKEDRTILRGNSLSFWTRTGSAKPQNGQKVENRDLIGSYIDSNGRRALLPLEYFSEAVGMEGIIIAFDMAHYEKKQVKGENFTVLHPESGTLYVVKTPNSSWPGELHLPTGIAQKVEDINAISRRNRRVNYFSEEETVGAVTRFTLGDLIYGANNLPYIIINHKTDEKHGFAYKISV